MYDNDMEYFFLQEPATTDIDTYEHTRSLHDALPNFLSKPRSTGNRALLPQVREYCAAHPDIFHYEVEHVDQSGEAIRTIAMVSPRVVAINGGDGTVPAALTELYSGGHFGGSPPPVAVLPHGPKIGRASCRESVGQNV